MIVKNIESIRKMDKKSSDFFSEIPKFGKSSFCSIFGISNSGKSTYIKNLLAENKIHFTNSIDRLIVIHSVEDDCIKELKTYFPNKKGEKPDGKYFKSFPTDLMEHVITGHTVIVIDDKENELTKNKDLQKQLIHLSTVLCHHQLLNVFVNFQTFNPLNKINALNPAVTQSTNLIFFRNANDHIRLQRVFRNYNIKLKKGQSLYSVYDRFVNKELYGYLMLDVSPTAKFSKAYSHMLLCDPKPMLSFHDSDSDFENEDA